MSREYARRSRGGGNLPLIIAIIGTVIVIAVILYFVLGNGGGGLFGAKETATPYISPAPETATFTPGPSFTVAPSPSLIIVSPSESPSEVITTPPPTPTPAPSYADAKVWANTLNVHEGASLDSTTIGKVHYGERYKVWEETSKFLKIQMTNGVFGWVWRDYCVRGDSALPSAPTKEPEPSFMSKAEFTGANTIKVTFTENVWGNSGKTEKVSATVFTVKEGSTEISITGISDCAGGTYVNLTIGNTSGGTVTVSLDEDGVYNTDGDGTPAGSYSIGSSSDSVAPTVSFDMTSNVITATFSETVYANNDGTGSLTKDDFAVTPSPAGKISDYSVSHSGKTVTITVTYNGLVSEEEVITYVTLKTNSAYDAAGNVCAQTTDDFTYKEP